MRATLAVLFFLTSVAACSGVVEKPANLLSKSQMAEILAEMALNDQASMVDPSGNIEAGTRFILQQRKIKAQDFTDSYQYYAISGKIEPILEEAQDLVMEKDPGAEDYIKKKLKESPEVPAFAR